MSYDLGSMVSRKGGKIYMGRAREDESHSNEDCPRIVLGVNSSNERTKNADLREKLLNVSATHATLYITNSPNGVFGVCIRDRDSLNGTFIKRDSEIVPVLSIPAPLRDRDKIIFGRLPEQDKESGYSVEYKESEE